MKTLKYEYLTFDNLVKLNRAAKKKNKNQYLSHTVLNNIQADGRVIVLVTFKFLHNECEWRLVLHAGDQFGSLLLDVDNLDLVQKGVYNKKEAA